MTSQRRSPRAAVFAIYAVGMFVTLSVGSVAAQQPGAADSLFRRAQRLVLDGDGAAGRALVDSVLRAATEGTDGYADALFWRAMLAAEPQDAQRDYLAIVVDYALSPRAADALLHLGQSEFERGERDAARRHLERLVLEYGETSAARDGWFWLGRSRMPDDLAGGCQALDSARVGVAATNVERINQVSYYAQPCRALAAATNPPAVPTTTGPPPKETRPDTLPARPRYSAQVAAFKTEADAEGLAKKLQARGYDARVASLKMFHVRIGEFATKTEAAALVAKLKQQRIDAFVVEAEPREP